MMHRLPRSIGPCLAALTLGVAIPALAHHSATMFDMTREVVIDGTVKDFQWTNPHSWLLLEVPGQHGGAATIWSFEAGPPSVLSRMGVKKSSFVPGEKVAVHAWPIKDKTPAGLLMNVVRPGGVVINVASLEKTDTSGKSP